MKKTYICSLCGCIVRMHDNSACGMQPDGQHRTAKGNDNGT